MEEGKEKTLEEKLEELSETEMKAYEFIKEKPRMIPDHFNDNPRYLGALGKLKSRRLVETYKEYTDIGRNMVKKRRYVKIVE